MVGPGLQAQGAKILDVKHSISVVESQQTHLDVCQKAEGFQMLLCGQLHCQQRLQALLGCAQVAYPPVGFSAAPEVLPLLQLIACCLCEVQLQTPTPMTGIRLLAMVTSS